MTLELYSASGSLGSQKVKLVLAEKNLEWNNHLLNLLTFENLQPSYIQLNSQAVVPTLVHNDTAIADSAVIIRYLDEQFRDPTLTPVEPKLREKMNSWIELQNQFPMRELMYGNYQGINGIVLRRSVQIKEKLLSRLMQIYPELAQQYASKLQDVKRWNSTIQSDREIADINARIAPMLDRLEEQLNQTDWLCGATYTLADAVWTAVINRLDELKFNYLWKNNTRLKLESYFNRLKSRPSFAMAIENDKMPLSMLMTGLYKVVRGV